MSYFLNTMRATTAILIAFAMVVGLASVVTVNEVSAQECTPPQLEIVSDTSLDALVGSDFAYIVVTEEGSDDYVLSSGLPDGLSFSDGMMTGAPTTAGEYTVVFSASNDCGTVTDEITITVYAGTAATTGGDTSTDETTGASTESAGGNPSPAPTESVTLDEVPDTGLSADYFLTISFYLLALLALAVGVVNFMTKNETVGSEESFAYANSSGSEVVNNRSQEKQTMTEQTRADFSAWKRSHDRRLIGKSGYVDGIRRSN